jgi:hypothetical protein
MVKARPYGTFAAFGACFLPKGRSYGTPKSPAGRTYGSRDTQVLSQFSGFAFYQKDVPTELRKAQQGEPMVAGTPMCFRSFRGLLSAKRTFLRNSEKPQRGEPMVAGTPMCFRSFRGLLSAKRTFLRNSEKPQRGEPLVAGTPMCANQPQRGGLMVSIPER